MFVGRKDNPAFETWGSALGHIADRCPRDKRTVFVFDEFPYAAIANPSLPSTLQIAIDHAFKSANLMLTLCGSNEGFMESEVLGYKSPLYGRRTIQIRLKPLGYRDDAHLLAGKTPEEQAIYYAASIRTSLDSSRSSHARVAPSPIKELDIGRSTARSPRNRRSQQGRPPRMRRPSSRRCRECRAVPLAWPASCDTCPATWHPSR